MSPRNGRKLLFFSHFVHYLSNEWLFTRQIKPNVMSDAGAAVNDSRSEHGCSEVNSWRVLCVALTIICRLCWNKYDEREWRYDGMSTRSKDRKEKEGKRRKRVYWLRLHWCRFLPLGLWSVANQQNEHTTKNRRLNKSQTRPAHQTNPCDWLLVPSHFSRPQSERNPIAFRGGYNPSSRE